MGIESLHAMKTQPGAVVIGKVNAESRAVFNDICARLTDFYDQTEDLAFRSTEFVPGQDTYRRPIYIATDPDYVYVADDEGNLKREAVREGNKTHATIKIERFGEERKVDKAEECDFAISPFVAVKQRFGIYFNLTNRDEAMTERDNFLAYARR